MPELRAGNLIVATRRGGEILLRGASGGSQQAFGARTPRPGGCGWGGRVVEQCRLEEFARKPPGPERIGTGPENDLSGADGGGLRSTGSDDRCGRRWRRWNGENQIGGLHGDAAGVRGRFGCSF